MASGCSDDQKFCKEVINGSSNNELTAVVVQGNSPLECSDEWLRSILNEECNSSAKNTIPTKHKIPKVHQVLRQMDRRPSQKSYDPLVISIGPYHHGKEELKPMEKFKIRLTREFVNSCQGTSAELIYKKIAGLAEVARKCYADESSTDRFDNKEFTRMMFVDGCFLLQFIFCSIDDDKQEEKLKLKNHDIAFIQKDLFLLENQLPFMVLKALMSFTKTQEVGKIKQFVRNPFAVTPPPESFWEKVENFIAKHFRCRSSPAGAAEVKYEDDPAHLLELMRREIIDPGAFKATNTSTNWYSFRSVQELKTAGIIFRPNRLQRKLLTDVRYEPLIVRAVLRLPVMTIDDSTKPLLLNLVAYEMCPDSPDDFGVTSYLWLMDKMIDHPDDVKELRRRGILLNVLSSDEEVAKLFNEMTDYLVTHPNAYADVESKIEKFCKKKVKVWITEFLHTHFTTPWTAMAFAGALIALSLSAIQSYYAVKSCE